MTETYLSNYLASKAAASKRKMIASCVVSILLATCGIVAGMTLNSALYALVIPSVGVLLVTPRHRSSWEYGTEGEERLQRHSSKSWMKGVRCFTTYRSRQAISTWSSWRPREFGHSSQKTIQERYRVHRVIGAGQKDGATRSLLRPCGAPLSS